jgi:hypothetical protein
MARDYALKSTKGDLKGGWFNLKLHVRVSSNF